MTPHEEQQLAALALKADDLRACVDAAKSMIRAWSKREKRGGLLAVTLSDGEHWEVRARFPADVVTEALLPVLRQIGDTCAAELLALPAEISTEE